MSGWSHEICVIWWIIHFLGSLVHMGRTPTLLGQAGRSASSELTRLRRAAGLTQAELTDRVNATTGHRLPKQAITEMENQRRRLDVDDLVALAQVLGSTPHAMLGWVARSTSTTPAPASTARSTGEVGICR